MQVSTSHSWKNKVCCFLGDSITDGIGTIVGNRYFDYLAEDIGIDATGYGVNGSLYSDLKAQAERMYSEKGKNVDCVFVFAGTNNFYGNTPIGDWFRETTKQVEINHATGQTAIRKVRSFTTGNSTLKSQINELLSYLKHKYADSTIIVMTPIHRAYAKFGDDNIQYNELYANDIGIYLEEYVKAIREACDIWSVELIDLYSASGLFPVYDEFTKYFSNSETDRLHPNELGHRRIADVIISKLMNINNNTYYHK